MSVVYISNDDIQPVLLSFDMTPVNTVICIASTASACFIIIWHVAYVT